LIDLRFFACFVLAQLVVASKHPWAEKLKALVPSWLLWTAIILAIISVLQVSVLPHDFLAHFGYNKDITISPISTVDNKSNVLRAFATMRGPNTLGAYLLIPLACALYFVIKKRNIALAAAALGLGLIALLLTDSRSAWLGFMVTAALVLLYVLPRQGLIKWTKRLAVPVVLAVGILLWAATSVPSLRLAIFHSSAKDVNPALLAGSTDAHWRATLTGIRYIGTHPLGTGIGSAGPASFYNTKAAPLISEDYFVQIGEEAGILGLLLFLAINVLVSKQLLEAKTPTAYLLFASFVGLSLISIFLHGWADDPTAMTWWALAGLYIFDKKGEL
ncbi:MAG TPA: O-antigen ligase family protein, partial [Candidatus Acidoferrum sp.]|nr:O-antigen ligase family protein [Candidatus Acidoferrum sp.]